MFKDDESVKFLQDPDVTNKFSNCKALSDVNPSEYDAVFYPGGKFPIPRPSVIVGRLSVNISDSPQVTGRSSISRMILKTRKSFRR